jgi:hypothetical protein
MAKTNPQSVATSIGEPSPDVPIFLRKTYYMIDQCDDEIACWSEDGTTFVVKDPDRFERTIIPQYFKHSKFSSFVRQLNFYSFRKIKYADTIRIDPKLEAETANYWRFRHENFQKGKPELLTEIKRMNGQKAPTSPSTSSSSSVSTTQGNKVGVTASAKVTPDPDGASKASKSEVQSLQKRIEEMTKNIDQLTAMVQKVSLKQEEEDQVGSKRKKTELLIKTEDFQTAFNGDLMMDVNGESDQLVRPDDMFSNMELDEIITATGNKDLSSSVEAEAAALSITPPSPVKSTVPMIRETSVNTQVSDNEFVDQLFTAFNEDSDDLFQLEPPSFGLDSANRPDAELMKRLSDALMLLPRDIQVMIVERLIAAITSTESLKPLSKENTSKSLQVQSAMTPSTSIPQTLEEEKQDVPMPLAAATLAALLHHYSSQIQAQQQGNKSKQPQNVQKSIPVIPVHA